MDWLTSLPALLLLVTAPLMVLMMVDAFTRNFSAQRVEARDPQESHLIVLVHAERHDQEAEHRDKKAA